MINWFHHLALFFAKYIKIMNDFERLEEYKQKLSEVSNLFNECMKKQDIQLEDLKNII